MTKKILSVFLALTMLMPVLFQCTVFAEPASENRTKYQMNITLDEENFSHPKLNISTQVTLTNQSEDIWTEICFRDFMSSLYKWESNIESSEFRSGIRSASANGDELVVRTEQLPGLDEDYVDSSAVYVELARPLSPGETTTIHLEYEADLFEGGMRCSYGKVSLFSEDDHRTYELAQFYPMLAVYENGAWNTSPYITEGECFYTECADYHIELQIPEHYEVIASGNETPIDTSNGTSAWNITAENMRDVTIIISDEYQQFSGEVCGVRINSYYVPNNPIYPGDDHEEQGQIQLQAALDSVAAFTEAYGAYPYEELDVVESNYQFGGMEAPGLIRISQLYSWFIGEDDSEADHKDNTSKCAGTVAHETAHEWFYAVIGNDQFEEAWLDESFAAFSEQVYWRYVGRTEDEVAKVMQAFLDDIPASGNLTVDRGYDELNGGYHYEYTDAVYQRGAGFLYLLEQAMGDVFYDFMKDFYSSYSFQLVHTEDFITAIAPYIEGNDEAQSLINTYLSVSLANK